LEEVSSMQQSCNVVSMSLMRNELEMHDGL